MLDALLHLLEGIGFPAQAIHLRPAGHAGLDVVTPEHPADLVGKHLVVGQRVRPRPDQRHLPAQHVQELRQFVDVRPPQDRAHARHARIVADGLAKPGARIIHAVHAAEFQHLDRLVVEAEARLAEQRRPARLEPDQRRDHDEQRPERHQQHRGARDVEGPLEEAVPQRTRPAEQLEHPQMAVGTDAAAAHEFGQFDRQELDADRKFRQCLDGMRDHLHVVGAEQDQHGIDRERSALLPDGQKLLLEGCAFRVVLGHGREIVPPQDMLVARRQPGSDMPDATRAGHDEHDHALAMPLLLPANAVDDLPEAGPDGDLRQQGRKPLREERPAGIALQAVGEIGEGQKRDEGKGERSDAARTAVLVPLRTQQVILVVGNAQGDVQRRHPDRCQRIVRPEEDHAVSHGRVSEKRCIGAGRDDDHLGRGHDDRPEKLCSTRQGDRGKMSLARGNSIGRHGLIECCRG